MRRLSCCIATILMLCLGTTAFAQTMPPTFCGDLSQTDCEILTNAQTASATLDSALYDFSFDVNISNVPDMSEPLNFNLTGSGSFSGMAALQNSAMNMMSMQGDMSQMMQVYSDLIRGVNADINLTLNLPAELVREMGSTMPNSINVQARLVDGFGYLNLDTLTPLMGSSNTMGMTGWVGLDLASLLDASMAQMTDMMDEMNGMMDDAAMSDMMAQMEQFYDPEFLSRFASVTRIDDGSGATALFQFDIDLGAMMGSPAFQDLMRQQMMSQAEMMGSSAMDEQDMEQALAMVSQMFKGISFVMTEEIGLEDGFVHRVNGAMSFDTAGMMAAMGETTSSNEAPPVVNITFSFGYSSFNSAPAITAPEDATIIPWQMLLGTEMATPAAMTPTMTVAAATTVPTAEATSEMTPEPTAEVTAEPTIEPTVEVTVEPTVVVVTPEPTVEVTVSP